MTIQENIQNTKTHIIAWLLFAIFFILTHTYSLRFVFVTFTSSTSAQLHTHTSELHTKIYSVLEVSSRRTQSHKVLPYPLIIPVSWPLELIFLSHQMNVSSLCIRNSFPSYTFRFFWSRACRKKELFSGEVIHFNNMFFYLFVCQSYK